MMLSRVTITNSVIFWFCKVWCVIEYYVCVCVVVHRSVLVMLAELTNPLVCSGKVLQQL